MRNQKNLVLHSIDVFFVKSEIITSVTVEVIIPKKTGSPRKTSYPTVKYKTAGTSAPTIILVIAATLVTLSSKYNPPMRAGTREEPMTENTMYK